MLENVEIPKKYYKRAHPNGWPRVSEVARMLDVTSQAVLKMLSDGRLKGEQPDGENSLWFVDPDSIERLRRDNER